MRTAKLLLVLTLAMSGLPACAVFDKCSPENCATDKQIVRNVNQLVIEHPGWGPPAAIHVQSINGVVYLDGTVDSDLTIRSVEAQVRQVANVKDVVNSLNSRSNSR
jgi:osmotically-inducible protein OsmY